MANIALQRIQKEIKEVLTSDEVRKVKLTVFWRIGEFFYVQIVTIGIKIEVCHDDQFKMKGEIKGPPDTPYQGGKFRLAIEIPENYPFHPPKVCRKFSL